MDLIDSESVCMELFIFVFFASVACLVGKEVEPKSEIRFGLGMSFQYHGQMLHGLNRYYLMVGIHIPELRMARYYTPMERDRNFCNQFNTTEAQTLYVVCRDTWPAYITSVEKVAAYQAQIDHIVHEQLPAILPKFKAQDMEEPYFESGLGRKKRNVREKRFITELISLDIQGISALLNHRKQNKLQKGMKYLLMRQEVLNNQIIILEDDMTSLTKATLSELDYLRKELESTGMWIKHLTKKIKVLELEISRNSARITDNSNAIVILSGTISICFLKWKDIWLYIKKLFLNLIIC